MKFRLLNILLIALFQIGWIGHHAVPTLTASRDMLAASSDTHDVGTPSKIWRNGYFRFLDLTTTLKPETSKASQEMIFASTDGHVYRMSALGSARQLDGKVGTTLLHLNSSFLDSASSDRVFVSADNANVTGAQSKFGGGSLALDGTGDYISTGDSSDWNFGAGDFTIDCWISFNALPSLGDDPTIIGQYDAGGDKRAFTFRVLNDTGVYYLFGRYSTDGINTTNFQSSAISITTNTFYHVALVRSGNTGYLLFNGTVVSTFSFTGTIFESDAVLMIGSSEGTSRFFNGWIDELRISKGNAQWTGNFTPETKEY